MPPDFMPPLPTVTVTDQMTLYHGGRAVEILYLGHRRLFAGASKVRDTLFSAYVAGPALTSAFRDASSKR